MSLSPGTIITKDSILNEINTLCNSFLDSYPITSYTTIDQTKLPITAADNKTLIYTVSNGCYPWSSSLTTVKKKLVEINKDFLKKVEVDNNIITASTLSAFILSSFYEIDRINCQTYSYYENATTPLQTLITAYGIDEPHKTYDLYVTDVSVQLKGILSGLVITASSINALINQLSTNNIRNIQTFNHGQRNHQEEYHYQQFGYQYGGNWSNDHFCHWRRWDQRWGTVDVNGTPCTYLGVYSADWSYPLTLADLMSMWNEKLKGPAYSDVTNPYIAVTRRGDEDWGNWVFITNSVDLLILKEGPS